ncbi:Rne/Rng family ribonuclease [Segatella buccae]|uniref:S1 RNA binding domain protein n=1 Tax=Segatella buccae ATCC 33574 TaxID=873513 RepID=E6K9Y4_9BACT|nr:Rne/Rng family ribonuclease [Segatella buccae]EFU29552.1 S1 RNA binding domain protein [Segatella buccae ATCC 33574]
MTSEVVIDVRQDEISIALLEDKQLVEYQNEPRQASFTVGNIYMAKVKKLMPGLNACFVDVGYERDAFLHYLDLGSQFNSYQKYFKQVQSDRKKLYPFAKATRLPDLDKAGSITQPLQPGQEVMVQIVKEPISTKGPRLTGELSFAGRYLVLIPFGDKVSVSTKIKSGEERARLKQLIHSIKPKNCGVIVRTVAEGKRVAELDAELKVLNQRWEDAIVKVQKTQKRPQLVFEETGRAVALLRDLFDPTYENIYVNDEGVMNEVKHYVSLIAPEKADIVKLYTGKLPIFDNFNITKQIKASFGKTINYKHGAYLIIEHTEALHVVDVNSGNRTRQKGQEANALDVNLGAADELARQLRLRDMGGIIVVDFIDMNLAEDRQMLYERMCKNMQKDRAKHNILPLSKFGLMQITRQRVRPAMDVNVEETCPTCNGTGKIRSSILFTDQLEGKIDRLVNKIGISTFSLHVHPYVAAYINQGVFSLKRKWQLKYGFGISVVPSQKLAFLQYEFYDKKRQFIDMKEEIEIK